MCSFLWELVIVFSKLMFLKRDMASEKITFSVMNRYEVFG